MDVDPSDIDVSHIFGLDLSCEYANHLVPTQDRSCSIDDLGFTVPSSPTVEDFAPGLDEDYSFLDEFAPSHEPFCTPESIKCEEPCLSPTIFLEGSEPQDHYSGNVIETSEDIPIASDAKLDGDGEFTVITPAKGKALYTDPVDTTDRNIQKLFPEWTLRLERNQFNAWRKKSNVRKLNTRENEVLKRYRRTMLARVYADRARHLRAAKHGAATSRVDQLHQENIRLRQRVAALERKLSLTQRINR